MFALRALLIAAFCTNELVCNDAVAHGSSMIRREEASGQLEVSASGGFPKHHMRLRQSEQRPAQLTESDELQPSRPQHEEVASLPVDTVEVGPSQPDDSVVIKSLEEEVAALKARLDQNDAYARRGKHENKRRGRKKKRFATVEDEEDYTTQTSSHKYGKHHPSRHPKHHSSKEARVVASKSTDTTDWNARHVDSDADSIVHDTSGSTWVEFPPHVHNRNSRHGHDRHHRDFGDEVAPQGQQNSERGLQTQTERLGDSSDRNDAMHGVGRPERDARLNTVDPISVGSSEPVKSDAIEARQVETRRNSFEKMSSDEQNKLAQKLVSASRKYAHAIARTNANADSNSNVVSTSTRPLRKTSNAPIEFEPWVGTTNAPLGDPSGQDEYIQSPQMLATFSLDDNGAKAPPASTTSIENEFGEGGLTRSFAANEEISTAGHDAINSPESDGASEYGLKYPPKNRPQLEQYLRIAREMERVELMGGVSEQGARNAFKNLYVNWTHTDYNATERYLSGIRIRIVGQQIFYSPEPPELRQLASTQPPAFERMFSIVAAHVLSFLTGTMAKFKLPNSDFTIAFGDFCVGTTRLFHDAWGTKKRTDLGPKAASGTKLPPEEAPELDALPNAEFTEAFQVPVFQWTNTQSGRKACNVITTSTYDWNWWNSNFTEGNSWRLDHPPPTWKQRISKMVWRGSLMSQESIRSRALRIGLRHPEWFDVKGVKAGDCEKFVADLAESQDLNTLADCQAAVSTYTPMEEQLKYKYTLEMDGGGTTFRFKNVLLGGFLVFKVDSDTTQFWSESLQPFVHYIPVSKENFEQDLIRKLHWAMEHDTDCEHIAANARRFALEYLRDADAHWQQQAAISVYAGRQNFIPVGPELGMVRFCCKDAANVNLKAGVKLTGLASECVDHDPACATSAAPNEMLYSMPRLQDVMRASTLEELAVDINTTKDLILNVHDVAKLANRAPPLSNMQIWKEFADVLQPFKLIEGHVMQDSSLSQMMQSYASNPEVKTICEVGFNAGHSALLLLLSNPSAHVYSFDISHYKYTTPAAEFVSLHFPERFTFVRGDSSQTLPAFRSEHTKEKCDLAIVDGAHLAPWPQKDILNFWHLASGPESKIIMMDTSCEISWCSGPSSAWREMRSAGIIREISSHKIDKTRGFSVGVFQKAPDSEDLKANPIDWPSLPVISNILAMPSADQAAAPQIPQGSGISTNSQIPIEGPAVSMAGDE